MSQNAVITPAEIAGIIDHTMLKPDAGEADIRRLCAEAVKNNFAAVCVNGYRIALVSELLADCRVAACTVVGFPLGAGTAFSKAQETRDAVASGAAEVDMVLNIGAAKDGNWQIVRDDITAVVEAAEGALVKVILETCLLSDDEKKAACEAAVAAGADFVKTSTGFAGGGATEADIRLMRKAVGESLGVKASGGVKTYEAAVAMITAGANRIGTSSSISIISEQCAKGALI